MKIGILQLIRDNIPQATYISEFGSKRDSSLEYFCSIVRERAFKDREEVTDQYVIECLAKDGFWLGNDSVFTLVETDVNVCLDIGVTILNEKNPA